MGHTKTIASFFSGYGGLEMGIRSALGGKCRTIVFVEREAYAVANLVAKIEEGKLDAAPIHTDVTTFPYRKFRGLVDIACGGVPCQPHSVAGKRKGGSDERFLFDAFFDGLAEMQPRQILIENVEGLLTSRMPDGSLCFKHIIERLEKMDYRVEAGLFTAAEVGAPHRRKRVFILARMENAISLGRRGRCEDGGEVRGSGVSEDKITGSGSSQEVMGNASSEGFPRNGACEQFNDIQDAERGSGEGRKELGNAEHDGLHGSKITSGVTETVPDHTQGQDTAGESTGTDTPGELANPNQPRPQGRNCGELPERTVQWPARPGSPQFDWEEPRTVEPFVGNTADGPSERVGKTSWRVDELRILGNGVVPQQAARAYQVLSERLK